MTRQRMGDEMKGLGRVCVVAGLMLALSLPAFAAGGKFQGDLDPCPEDNSTRDAMTGTGNITANLAGNMLIIEGRFAGFSSLATAAHLHQGQAMGVPGPAIATLTVAHAGSGEVSGQVKLTGDQLAALGRGALYVQLDSEKAPTGNSWAWLEAPAP
jgi:hypothetical protein